MKSLAVIGFALGTVLAGCASTRGAQSESAQGAAPAHQHDNGAGMAGMCPMQVPGTTVAATEVDGGIRLSFTTATGDAADLRQRVRRMADMHNQPRRKGSHGTAAPGGMMMPPATASAEDTDSGGRLTLQPKDPDQLAALREHVRMKARRMGAGKCPMMSLASGGDAAPANSGEGDHDAHHPGK